MKIDFLRFEWWVEDDGTLWLAHRHTDVGPWDEWMAPTPWRVVGSGVEPSLDCSVCGAHTILCGVDNRDRLAGLRGREWRNDDHRT